MIKFEDVKNITAEEFFKGNEFSIKTVKDKYNAHISETPAEIFYRVASGIAFMEETPELQEYWTNRWFDEMYSGRWMAGGSILSGVGTPGKISLMNCTTLPLFEDNLEGIFNNAYFLAKDAAYRQGVGADFSKIRPKGCVVNNSSKVSLGPLHWMKFIDSIGNYVGQKGRIPAMLLSLRVDHPDIEDFIVSKLDLNVIQNANISTQITDEFMEAYKDNKCFELKFVVEDTKETITKTVNARELMKKIAEYAWKSGEPGVQFIDRAKYWSNSDYVGYPVISTNACCVVADTIVQTDEGRLSIKEIYNRFGEDQPFKILSYNIEKNEYEWKDLINAWQQRNDSTVQLQIGTGEENNLYWLECSLDHPILTQNRSYVKAEDLTQYDDIVIQHQEALGHLINKTIKRDIVPLYDIEVADNHNFVVNDGIVIKNSEQFLSPHSLCNLASINIGSFPLKIKQAEIELANIASSIIRFSDNVVSYECKYNKSANIHQKNDLLALRRCGIGITNLHGWLLKKDTAYDSDEAVKNTTKILRAICFGAYKTSQELGKEKGNFGAFTKENYIKSPFVKNLMDEFDFKFDHMRNVCCTSIAPTGTISLMFQEPTLSTGIEPAPGLYYWKRSRTSGNWVWYFVVPDFIRKDLNSKGINLTFEGSSIQDNDGKIGEENIKIIDQYYPKDKFKPAHLVDPFKKVELMAGAMKYVDSSVSCTYNLPESATVELIEQIYVKAWEKGVKSVAVYRDKTRAGVIEFEPPYMVEARFKEIKPEKTERPIKIVPSISPKRPKELLCDIHHTQIKGDKWVVLIGKLGEDPYEMFAGPAQGIKLPDKGKIVKTKSRTYLLECEDKEPINILETFKENGTYAYSKLLSHGVPIWGLCEMTDKMLENVMGFNKAMGRIFKKYLKNTDLKYLKCKNCGSTNIIFQENCLRCDDCGFSKCS